MTGRRQPSSPRKDRNRAPLTVGVLTSDEVLVERLASLLGAAGVAIGVSGFSAVPTPEDAPAVLVMWSGRGIVARGSLVRRVRSQLPETALVVVGPEDSPSSVRAVLEAGAHGLVFSTDVEVALASTVMAVWAGQVAVPAACRRAIGSPTFTTREKEVLGLALLDLSNREISATLFLSESTVKSHLSSAYAKLGVRSRNEAATMVLDPQQRLGLGVLSPAGT